MRPKTSERPRVLALALVLVAGILAGCTGGDDGDAAPAGTAPAERPKASASGLFLNECRLSHSGPDDPIVHRDHPGSSHLHDFFGSAATDDNTTLDDLQASETVCQHQGDRSAYWSPALFDGDTKIEPRGADAYYRAGPDVDPAAVEPYPAGLMAIAKSAPGREDPTYTFVGWGCGRNRTISEQVPNCGDRKGLTMHALFPDCWDGVNLDSDDHISHTAYSRAGVCPASHPTSVPQLELVVRYDFWGPPDNLSLSSGEVDTAHADFFNGWDDDKLANEVARCLARGIVCGVPTPP